MITGKTASETEDREREEAAERFRLAAWAAVPTFKPGDRVAVYEFDRPKSIGEVSEVDTIKGRTRYRLAGQARAAYDRQGFAWSGGAGDWLNTSIKPLTADYEAKIDRLAGGAP